MKLLGMIRMVLWSFFGIRRRAGAEEELARMRPLSVLAVAVTLAACFAGVLVSVARFVAGAAG